MIKKTLHFILVAGLIFLGGVSPAFSQKVTVLQQGRPSSLRGLSVVDDKIAWVSGSKGYVACTKDAGKTWNWMQIKGFEQSDFRDIEAFSAKEAVVMSSGTPAVILKTLDGGLNWQVRYHNRDTSVFLDAMDFKSKYGCIMGDPINNHFVIFETFDRGATWKQRDVAKTPLARAGEAAFAASGSCLMINTSGLMRNYELALASGGSVANIVYTLSAGKKWFQHVLPLVQGTTSSGAFSVAADGKHWVAVGGDYQHDQRTDSTACYSVDAGKTWKMAKATPAFQSCVEYLSGSKYLATGTSGTNFSKDGGITWKKIDANSFNVCNKAKSGKLVLLAGNNGKIAVFTPPKEYLIPYIKL
ncbi:WD40/YVTN/BNR-like repeat-containing protein [Mucilaginibacter paludis]|uniref:Oxidoreductase n=1 Tax=Mucilaginibacter paludis DSM 18603 TaxID=714943 RepID=H1YB00_9SPHI|nr:YCF48-related protein [Mucilaginibacter paludis]EHQ30033.1 oxidoreductase [Mucilaginibacter paludis DSM 18603]